MGEAAQEAAAKNARRAFDRAVKRERAAILMHERAARMHQESALKLEVAASLVGEPAEGAFRRRARVERELARIAFERAAVTRQRLFDEGISEAQD